MRVLGKGMDRALFDQDALKEADALTAVSKQWEGAEAAGNVCRPRPPVELCVALRRTRNCRIQLVAVARYRQEKPR